MADRTSAGGVVGEMLKAMERATELGVGGIVGVEIEKFRMVGRACYCFFFLLRRRV